MIARRALCAGMALAASGLAGHARAIEPQPELVRAVAARLVNEPLLRGEFEQRKSIKGFRNPLISRGDFIVARQRGVLWRTLEPFASSMLVTPDRMLLRQADGRMVRQLHTSEEPALRAIGETLFGLIAADLSGLAQRFRITGQADDAGWRLSLVPIDAGMARWLQRVELEGDRFLRGVRLAEASGDQTSIRLTRHTTASSLTPQQEALFE